MKQSIQDILSFQMMLYKHIRRKDTYSSDLPVQTVFQFGDHKSIFGPNYVKHLQHHEHLQMC